MAAKVLLGLISGAIFLALALWGVPLAQIGGALSGMELPWLAPVAAVFLVQQGLRGWRQLMLVDAVAPGGRWWRHTGILCMSFFCINTLPARLGEVLRPWLLKDLEGVPFGAGFGVVFAERAIDLVFVLITLSGILLFADLPTEPLIIGDRQWEVVELGRVAGLGVLPPLLLLVGGLAFFGAPVQRGLEAAVRQVERLLPVPVIRRLGALGLAFTASFSEGLAAFRRPALMLKISALTTFIWCITGTLYMMLAHAFGIQDSLGWLESMGVMVIQMLGSMMPAPPGMAGVYEAFVRAGLALFGIRGPGLDGVALAFALTIHWWTYLVQSASALYFFWACNVSPVRVWGIAHQGLSTLRGSEPPSSTSR